MRYSDYVQSKAKYHHHLGYVYFQRFGMTAQTLFQKPKPVKKGKKRGPPSDDISAHNQVSHRCIALYLLIRDCLLQACPVPDASWPSSSCLESDAFSAHSVKQAADSHAAPPLDPRPQTPPSQIPKKALFVSPSRNKEVFDAALKAQGRPTNTQMNIISELLIISCGYPSTN
jgi:hypothetical protein